MLVPRTIGHLLRRDGLYVEPRVAHFIPGRRRIKRFCDIFGGHVRPQPPVLHIHKNVVSSHTLGVLVRSDFADWFSGNRLFWRHTSFHKVLFLFVTLDRSRSPSVSIRSN
jgi:hypothetical protein